jgi:hypothetical protein
VLYQGALRVREWHLGLEYPETAQILVSLAVLRAEQECIAESHLLYQQALTIQVQRLGNEHSRTRETSTRYDRLAAWLEQPADPG